MPISAAISALSRYPLLIDINEQLKLHGMRQYPLPCDRAALF
jgi:hypothetical protein